MAIGKDISGLQAALGYTFADPSYLENALTHSSYSNEQKSRGASYPSNERLEFLGDAVLELVMSEYLYRQFHAYAEGNLTKIRQQLVCERTLSHVAARLSLGEYLHLGHGEESTDCRTRPKVLADATEAVIGAGYLDAAASGVPYADTVLNLILPELDGVSLSPAADAKTSLQQLVEKDGSATLAYEVVKEEGPAHNRRFTVEVRVNNNTVGTGEAATIKEAQTEAARSALQLFGVEP